MYYHIHHFVLLSDHPVHYYVKDTKAFVKWMSDSTKNTHAEG